jgi:hypothetical protein
LVLPLTFDALQARTKPVVTMLAILSQAEEVQFGERISLAQWVKRMQGADASWGRLPDGPGRIDLAAYLEGKRAIKSGNPVERYMRAFLADAYVKLLRREQELPDNSGRGPIFAKLRHFKTLKEPAIGEDPFVHSDVERIIDLVCGRLQVEARHPRHEGLAFRPSAIKTLFHGLGDRAATVARDAGIFLVIREARGRVAALPKIRDSLFRDLLWIRHLPSDLNGPEVAQRNPTDDPYGYYFSLVDPAPYALNQGSAPSAQEIQLSSVRVGEDWGSKTGVHSASFYFLRSDTDGPLAARQVMIEGATRLVNQRGAWQGLMVRPDWLDLERLELDMEAIGDPLLVRKELHRIGILKRLNSRGDQEERSASAGALTRPAAQAARAGGAAAGAMPPRGRSPNPNAHLAERLAGRLSYLKACFRYATFPWVHGQPAEIVAGYVAPMSPHETFWFRARITQALSVSDRSRSQLLHSIRRAISETSRAGSKRSTATAASQRILKDLIGILPEIILDSAPRFFNTQWFRFAPAQMLLSTDGTYKHAKFPRRLSVRIWALSNAGVRAVDDHASLRGPLRVRIDLAADPL